MGVAQQSKSALSCNSFGFSQTQLGLNILVIILSFYQTSSRRTKNTDIKSAMQVSVELRGTKYSLRQRTARSSDC